MRYKIIAIGKSKGSDYDSAMQTYVKRINGKPHIEEISIKKEKDPKRLNILENEAIRSAIPNGAFVIALTPEGKEFTSPALAQKIQNLENQSISDTVFLIGGADGLDDQTKSLADMSLSFGQMTWPHLLARVMLLEQLYRAQQILSGHPYHKE
ncbi:MAG TPA: 23S rRNA (pseudouridine(1915)-N(3))-methyltransferase RlmH [Rhodospirillaceae bacterium]|nr:23S rRNA (pseudouridine(1915)-N(3))-methyltransferase RlmH [Rhodospirillaceae bacterium]|tara:strand:+ start:121 stop:579 length:459 start_codon:yes stop_codon:yes gene_type:complete